MTENLLFSELVRQPTPSTVERCAVLFGQNRPRANHPLVLQDAAERFTPRLVEWADGTIQSEQATRDLITIGAGGDGYDKARRLEIVGYQTDNELVSLMDEFHDELILAAERAVKAWVRETNNSLLYRQGDRIVVMALDVMAEHPPRRREFTGTVIRLEPLTARYVVRIPELGHIEGGPGAIGMIVNSEDVIRLATKTGDLQS